MTGSFLFVKPSDPEGKRETAYSDKSPRYPYDHASWEWLLERALRRTLLPWALTKSHSRVLLYGHEDKYSMHRWGSYAEGNYAAGTTPYKYQGVGGPGSSDRKTDADLSADDRKTPLPESWNSSTGVPNYSSYGTKVAYGIVDLEETVALLPFSLEWLHPDWSSSALNAWDLTASTTQTTQGSVLDTSRDVIEWEWYTTTEHIPYDIPNDVPFKCLSHMRTDDPIVKVNITNDDNETIEVETAPTPVSAPRTTDGSIRDYHGTQVRVALSGAALTAGWALSEFYILHRHGLDYSPSTYSVPFGGSTSELFDIDNYTIGCLVDIPDKDSGNIIVAQAVHDEWAAYVPDVDWGGKQTWWHANGFPKGLDSVISPKLKSQLEDLCPMCQPAIPPAIPAFWEKFPDAGRLPWDHEYPLLFPDYVIGMYPHIWMQHLALACTPFDISARLDAMTTTVHRVPTLFAKIRQVRTKYSTSMRNHSETYQRFDSGYKRSSQSQEESTDREVVTVEGTTSYPIPSGNGVVSVSGRARGTRRTRGMKREPSWISSSSEDIQYTWEESIESNSEFLVCLRSTANTTLSTKTTTKTSTTGKSSYGDPSSSEDETSDGNLPDSYDPGPDDLLFPDWVLPWIETAELFASIESRLGRYDGESKTYSETHYYQVGGVGTHSYSGSGSGMRTHRTHRKIVSLGQMDTLTGRFPSLDAAAVLSEVDPEPAVPTGWGRPTKYDRSSTENTDSKYNVTKTEFVDYEHGDTGYRSRSVSYYVVVRWKFDRTDPETLETESSLVDLYRKLADARKALSDKRRELSDAQSALSPAQSALKSAEYDLVHAQEQLEDPKSAKPILLAEAQAALDRANQELSDAQSEKSAAQAEYAVAESDIRSAESSLQSAQEAYSAAVAAGEGVEEAQAALESAYTVYHKAAEAYNKASDKLANAEADEKAAQLVVDVAQEYYDTMLDNIEEILQKAVNDARKAVDDATSMVNEWTQKVNEAEGAIPGLEAAVEAAKQAIRDAGGKIS